MGDAPAWLVSMVVHLFALVALALVVVTNPEVFQGTLITAESLDEQEALVERVEVRIEQLAEAPVMSRAIASEDAAASVAVGLESAVTVSDAELGSIEVGGVEQGLFGMGGAALKETGLSGGDASFFGVKSKGRRFVFIVDSSSSMADGKFESAKRELLYSIRRLSSEQFFFVYFFDQTTKPMTLDAYGDPDTIPVRATPANIKRLEDWVKTVEMGPATNPSGAIRGAVEMLPDATYLLSDGEFTDNGLSLSYLERNNVLNDPVDGPKAKVIFHTLGFWERAGEPALKEIARRYQGTYRFVPRNSK